MFQLIIEVLWNFIKALVLFCLLAGVVITLLIGLGNGEVLDFLTSWGVGIFLVYAVVLLFNEWQKRKNTAKEMPGDFHEELSDTDSGQTFDYRTETSTRTSKKSKRTVTSKSHTKVVDDEGTTISITITSEKWTDSDEA